MERYQPEGRVMGGIPRMARDSTSSETRDGTLGRKESPRVGQLSSPHV